MMNKYKITYDKPGSNSSFDMPEEIIEIESLKDAMEIAEVEAKSKHLTVYSIMRKLTEEEYVDERGYNCKGSSCAHFRLDPFVAKYCLIDICKFKKTTRKIAKNPRGISGHFATKSSQSFGSSWHGNWGE